MSKLIGLIEIHKNIERQIEKIIKFDFQFKKMLDNYFQGMIDAKHDARGTPFPKKKESTKRAYEKKGYDTEHWLRASGRGTKLNITLLSNGIKIEPTGDYIKYVEQSDWWLLLSDNMKEEIIKYITMNIIV